MSQSSQTFTAIFDGAAVKVRRTPRGFTFHLGMVLNIFDAASPSHNACYLGATSIVSIYEQLSTSATDTQDFKNWVANIRRKHLPSRESH